MVAGGSLAGKDDGARHPVGLRVGHNRLIAGYDMQHVEQLPLVFMNTLDLNVKETVRTDFDASGPLNIGSQTSFVTSFDCRC